VHAVIEEEILYPAMREVLPDGDRLVDEALQEHQEAKELLSRIDGKDPQSRMPGARSTSWWVPSSITSKRRRVSRHGCAGHSDRSACSRWGSPESGADPSASARTQHASRQRRRRAFAAVVDKVRDELRH
jgi:hypothetical protein